MRPAFLILAAVACLAGAVYGEMTVSGISSGAFMAVQLHVAFSEDITGAGVVAGGPYWCAMDLVGVALTSCMSDPDRISVTDLISGTTFAEASLSIDTTKNLADDPVFILSGTADTVVEQGVGKKLVDYYSHYLSSSSQIQTKFDLAAEHSMPTMSYGNPCSFLGSPYISACDFDTAGAILNHLYSGLNPAGSYNNASLHEIDQKAYGSVELASMDSVGYVYRPAACASSPSSCHVHVFLHGCSQTRDEISAQLVLHAGFLEWAETNNMSILFPFAVKSTLNPKGCWDWWGYTGADYATKIGAQTSAIKRMADAVQDGSIKIIV